MHMSDVLISPGVASTMGAVTIGIIAYSVHKSTEELEQKKIPLMGVMGAFVFCAQMINFTIPGTGSSGHISGGLLLSAILGAEPAFLVMATIIIAQALFFSDGGILALGCNIFNMGFYSCMIAYPLIFKPIMKNGFSKKKIILASIISSIIGLQFGAFSVVIETVLSGKFAISMSTFLLLMQPIHLAIGLGEGIITSTVLCYIHSIRPEILEYTAINKKISLKKVIISMLIISIFIGGGLSLYASNYPDGLEWSINNIIKEELTSDGLVYEIAKKVQKHTAFMPDYSFRNSDSALGTSLSGIMGGAITLSFGLVIGFTISKIKKKLHN